MSDGTLEGQTGIRNRTGSAGRFVALNWFGGGGCMGSVLVRIVNRFGSLR